MYQWCVLLIKGIHSNLKANAVPKGVTSFPNLSVAK